MSLRRMELMTTLQQPMKNDACHTGIHSQKPEDKCSLSSGFYFLRRARSGCAARMLDTLNGSFSEQRFSLPIRVSAGFFGLLPLLVGFWSLILPNFRKKVADFSPFSPVFLSKVLLFSALLRRERCVPLGLCTKGERGGRRRAQRCRFAPKGMEGAAVQ